MSSSAESFFLETSTSTNFVAKSGSQGQQYMIVALEVSGTPYPWTEGESIQLSLTGIADDNTRVAFDSSEVAWSLESGPVSGIDDEGVATAGFVYTDSPVEILGAHDGRSVIFSGTVLNSGNDDFGPYAGDLLDDTWQVTYFGADNHNPDAAPDRDPDGDGQDNAAEFLTGFIPTDAGSRLTLGINDVTGTTAGFIINKVLPGNDYLLEYRTNVGDALEPWKPVTVLSPAEEGSHVPITDTSATDPARFYRLNVTPAVP